MSGHLTIVSGPSGSGKSSLIRKFMQDQPEYIFPTSVTTRKPREGEIDGDHYNFVDERVFNEKKDEGMFLEWACVYGLMYGTLKSTIINGIKQNKKFIKDIDVQGSKTLMETLPKKHFTSIFIMPPNLEILKKRLLDRKSETPESLAKRLDEAKIELQDRHLFDHIIVNKTLEVSYQEFQHCILDQK